MRHLYLDLWEESVRVWSAEDGRRLVADAAFGRFAVGLGISLSDRVWETHDPDVYRLPARELACLDLYVRVPTERSEPLRFRGRTRDPLPSEYWLLMREYVRAGVIEPYSETDSSLWTQVSLAYDVRTVDAAVDHFRLVDQTVLHLARPADGDDR